MNGHRSLKPLFTGISLIGFIFFCTAWLFQYDHPEELITQHLLRNSHHALAYKIDAQNTVRFQLNPQDTRIEIVTNLNLNSTSIAMPDDEWLYAIEVEVIDLRSGEIQREVFWEKTRHTEWVDSKTGSPMVAAFYNNDDSIACDSRVSTFFVPDNRGKDLFLNIRLKWPENASASLRVYHHVDFSSGSEIGIKPITETMKAKIRRHNLFGTRVNDNELRQFMSDIWQQVPAEGRSGIDYRTTKIFIYDDVIPVQGEIPRDTREAFFLDDTHPLALTIDGPAELRLSADRTMFITMKVFSRQSVSEIETVSLEKNSSSSHWFEDDEFLIDIQPADEMNSGWINVEIVKPNSQFPTPIQSSNNTPDFRQTSYYRILPISEGNPVRIDLPANTSGIHRPIKIVARIPCCTDSDSKKNRELHFTFFDKTNRIIANGKKEIEGIISPMAVYDPIGQNRDMQPGLPERFFLKAPFGAEAAEFYSDSPIDVAFYTALNPTHLRIEEGASVPNNDAIKSCEQYKFFPVETNYKDWFFFRPINHENLKEMDRHSRIRLPKGVLEINPTDAADRILNKAHQVKPITNHIDTYIWEFIGTADDKMEYAEPFYYGYFPSNQSHRFYLKDPNNFPQPLHLKYVLHEIETKPIKIMIDGIVISSFRPLSSEGIISIPPVEPGNHEIKIESGFNDDSFYLRHRSGLSLNSDLYARREVNQLEPGTEMMIPFHKKSWESSGINAMVYFDQDLLSEIVVEMYVNDLPEMTSGRTAENLTIPRRRFILNSSDDTDETIPSDMVKSQQIHYGHRLFFPIHDDIKPGKYTITISTQADIPVFFRFFKFDKFNGTSM